MKWNKDGANYTDLFVLNYHGINVFFGVGHVDEHSLCVYEIKSKKRKIKGVWADVLSKKRIPSTKPFFVPRWMNSWTRTTYAVDTFCLDGMVGFVINVTYDSPIYNEAVRLGTIFPKTGYVVAERIPQDKEYFFKAKDNRIKKVIIKC